MSAGIFIFHVTFWWICNGVFRSGSWATMKKFEKTEEKDNQVRSRYQALFTLTNSRTFIFFWIHMCETPKYRQSQTSGEILLWKGFSFRVQLWCRNRTHRVRFLGLLFAQEELLRRTRSAQSVFVGWLARISRVYVPLFIDDLPADYQLRFSAVKIPKQRMHRIPIE